MNTATSNPHISIVSPVYRAEKIIPELVRRISDSVSKITTNYEIILVEDCGPDKSWDVIEEIAKKNTRVKGFKLSRNFGQHYAITCGLDHAKGDWVVVMDCDLQDQPEEIPRLYNKAIETESDIVFAKRLNRKDSMLNKITSKLFYSFLQRLTGWEYDSSVANFGVYNKKVIDNYNKLREPIRVFPVMINWLGFTTDFLEVEHSIREEGKSSYTLKKRLQLALDIILAYSDKPLRLLVKLGLIISMSSFIFTIVILIRYLLGQITVSGYTSLIASLWFFSGLIIFTLGIVGLYIGKIFDGVKNRPLYVLSKQLN